MDKKFSISVVIPNFNGTDLLRQNLPFLYEALHTAEVEFEIIIPDDASTDDSIAFIQYHYPDILVLAHPINRGFAPTANAGMMAASKDLIFLVNSDVQLTPEYFNPQFKYFKSKETFGVMGRIIGMEGDKIQDAAKVQYKTGLKIGSGRNLIPLSPTEKWFPTLYLSGANALMDRRKIMELGGLDEIYAPFYGEDLDLCLRAWKVGWKCYYEHASICKHPNSVTINKFNKKKKIKITVYRNRFIMHHIHLTGYRWFLWNIWLGCQLLVKTLLLNKEFIIAFLRYWKLRGKAGISRKKMQELAQRNGSKKSNEAIFLYIDEIIHTIPHAEV